MKRIDIFDSRAIFQYVKRPYMTFSFRVVCVIMHKMACRKATTTCVWGHNPLILACMLLWLGKGRSLIVVHSIGMWMVCICLILFELCVRSKKKKKERNKERRKESTNRNFHVQVSQQWEEVMELWGYILHKKALSSIRVLRLFAVFILKLLTYLKYRTPF